MRRQTAPMSRVPACSIERILLAYGKMIESEKCTDYVQALLCDRALTTSQCMLQPIEWREVFSNAQSSGRIHLEADWVDSALADRVRVIIRLLDQHSMMHAADDQTSCQSTSKTPSDNCFPGTQ